MARARGLDSTWQQCYRQTIKEVERLHEINAVLLAELEWLDRQGGLGLDVHKHIRAAIAQAKGETAT